MPVTAADLPKIAFSRNEINLEITSDDFIAVAGVKAVTRIVFKDDVPDEHHIRILWAAGDVTFTADGSPDTSGSQFPTGDGGLTYVQALIAVFLANFYIARDFEVSYVLAGGFHCLLLTAINTGVMFNITAAAGSITAIESATAGVTEQLRPNFAQHVQVWLKRGSVFENIYRANLQLDYPFTGLTTKNIAPLLHPYLVMGPANNYASDKPSLSASGWQPCTNTLLEYYCRYGEYYGDTPEVKKLTTTATAFINLGGLDVATAPLKTLQQYLKPTGNPYVLCLRQGSRTKRVQRTQPEYLYWINLTGAAIDIKIRLEVFFSDGTGSQTYQIFPQNALAWHKYRVALGFDQLNIANMLPAGKACSYYTARVTDAAGALLSDIYTYVVDVYREYPRCFIYRNSLGGFQTLYTWGKGQNETSRKKEDIKRLATAAETAASGAMVETNIRIQQKFTVYTGYTTRRDISLLNDILVSGEIYLVNNGRMVPVGVSIDSLKEAADGENLNGASLEFYPLYDEVVFTDDLTAPETPNTSPGAVDGSSDFDTIWDDDNNEDDTYYSDL